MSSKDIGYYDLVSNYLRPKPKDVSGLNNSSYFYYRRQLFLKIYSLFDFKNYPDYWDIDYFKNILFSDGFIGVVDYNGGPWALKCGFSGINPYNNPTEIMIANPVLGNFNRTIGKDGELIYFNRVDGMYIGLEPLVKRYALLLSQCDGSINATLMNSRVRHVFEGTNDAEVQTYKKMYDEVSQGRPAVFLKKGKTDLKESNFNFLNVKNTYIGNDIMLTKRTIMNEFLTEIGINNRNTDKRERLTTDEVAVNDSETAANVILWLDTMRRQLDKVNKLFNTNITVELNKHVIKGTQDAVQAPTEPESVTE